MRPRSWSRIAALTVAAAVLVPSCGGGGQPASAEGSIPVSFESADGVLLSGRLFGPEGARVGVVLAHMRPADQRSWFGFARTLADEGYLALTFDFRGYCPGGEGGCSQGERDLAAIWLDVLAAIDLLRSRGATTVALVGASMGGTASLVAAAQPESDVAAVVTLSAPASIEGLEATREVLAATTGTAKLYIAGLQDTLAAEAAKALYDGSPAPKRYEIVTAGDHGTDLLTGSQGGAVERLILTWLAQHAVA